MQSSTRIKTSLFAICLFAAVLVPTSPAQVVPSGQSVSQQPFDQHQAKRFAASAKTSEDHQRIAQYYEQQAQYYDNLSRNFAAKIAAYERSPYLNSCAMCVTTSYSLEAAVRSLRVSKLAAEQRADEMRKLANMHEQYSSVATAPRSIAGF